MEKVTLSQKRNYCAAVKRGPNHAYIPHQVPPKSQEPVDRQEDESHVVVSPPPKKRRTFTPSQVAARFRAAIAREEPVQIEPAAVSIEVNPKRIAKPRQKAQIQNIRRSQQVSSNSIVPRYPRLPVVRAGNTTGTLEQYLVPKSKPIPAKPREPEVVSESSAESIAEDCTGPAPTEPKSTPDPVPESSAESVPEDASQTSKEPKSTPEPLPESEADSIENSQEKKAADSSAESISEDDGILPNPTTMDTGETGVAGEGARVEPDPHAPFGPAAVAPKPLATRPNPNECEICGRVLNSRAAKWIHKRTHFPPQFSCPAPGCAASFVRKFVLQRHQKRFNH